MKSRLPLPSNRSFGWTFTGALFIAGGYGVWRGGAALSWVLALAVLLAIVTSVRDSWLAPLNRAWMNLGELLGRVVSPVVLGVIFFGVFAPVGIVMRLCGRDAMARRFDAGLDTYWLKRDPPGPADGSFGNMY